MNPLPIGNSITPVVSTIVFIALTVYVVITFVLDYHLRRYITNEMRGTVAFARVLYCVISFIAIVTIILLTLSIFSPQ